MASSFAVPKTKTSSAPVPRSNPVVGTTMLPRVPLSYKWVIDGVKSFLRSEEVRSPPFLTSLPIRDYGQAFWNVRVDKVRSFMEQGSKKKSEAEEANTSLRIGLQHNESATMKLFLSQHQAPSLSAFETEPSPSSKQVLVSDCNFFILDPQNKVVFHAAAQNLVCEIGTKLGVFANQYINLQSVEFCKYSDLHKFVFNDTLTVQVDAMILCYTDPVQTSAPFNFKEISNPLPIS